MWKELRGILIREWSRERETIRTLCTQGGTIVKNMIYVADSRITIKSAQSVSTSIRRNAKRKKRFRSGRTLLFVRISFCGKNEGS